MKIFEFDDYKAFITKKIKLLPGHGRGELSRIAKALDIHTTMVTHVFRGEAHFSIEQTLNLADYFGFNELETEYLVALVQWERAGSKRAKDFCFSRVNELRNRSLNLQRRLGTQNKLSNEDRGIYYSSWIYVAVRLLTAIGRFQTVEALSKELQLPIGKVRKIVDFLVGRGLCIEENNKIKYGSIETYLESSSPHVLQHHLNWRKKTQEKLESIAEDDLIFTFPVVISDSDAKKIREKIVQLIEAIKNISDPSPSEELYSLNIDWVKLTQ